METILGFNVLEFVVLAWLGCVLLAMACDFGPEIFQDHRATWLEKHPKKESPEITIEMPVGSFDPETTITIPKVPHQKQEPIFIISKRPTGRHAKV